MGGKQRERNSRKQRKGKSEMARAKRNDTKVDEAKLKEARNKAVDQAISQIERQFGEGSIMRLSGDSVVPVEAIPTGALALDIALGVGGVPRGRVVEIYGQESSGKTSLCLHIIAEAQRLGGVAAFVDAEHALDPLYAKRIGVDLDNLLISQPDFGEQALEIVEMLVRSNAVDVIVIDSVAALAPRAEIEGDMGDSHMGLQARLMSQALRKLSAVISRSKACVIFTNQIREKIGVMFGSPETTPGGRALRFYTSVRLEMRGGESIRETNSPDPVGRRIKVKVVKNKVAPPFMQAEFDMTFGEGISKEGNILDVAVDNEIVEKSGSWYSYNGERLGQGRERVKQLLADNPEMMFQIEQQIREKLNIGGRTQPVESFGEPIVNEAELDDIVLDEDATLGEE